MKKIRYILASLLLSISLSGCSLSDNKNGGNVEPSTTDTTSSSETSGECNHHGFWHGDNDYHWKVCEECGEQFDYGEHECTVERNGDIVKFSCYCGFEYIDYYSELTISSFTIDSTNFKNFGTYNTGNYGNKAIGNWNVEYYRILSNYGYCFGIKPNFQDGDTTIPGAFYNTAGPGVIWSLELTYSSSADFYVKYGNNSKRTLSQTVSKNETTAELLLGKSRFFSIESGTSEVYITSIVINYINDSHSVLDNVPYYGTDYRIRPTYYSGELIPGETSVSVPTNVKIVNGKYTVLSYKVYTYYTYEYVGAHEEVKPYAALITREDVANYYLAFHRFPANYGMDEYDENRGTYPTIAQVKVLFDSNARKAQTFERTDGYAAYVPFNGEPPLYHELDIGLVGANYSTSSRGVGRLVMWDYGFSCYEDNDPVVVYTDDHYFTFQEYLNYNQFGDRFNAEGMRVSHAHKPAHTLTAGV